MTDMKDFVLHQVPYSTGRERPKIIVPPKSCDSHHHIYNPVKYPYDAQDNRNQPPATVDAYRLLQKRLGIERNVIVQASAYGTDNSCLLAALKEMGQENTRGIAVCASDISNQELTRLKDMGVCGLRINLASPLKINSYDEISPLANKLADFDMHMQFWISPNEIVELQPLLNSLRCPIVFDHRGHIPQPEGVNHPAFSVIADLLKDGKAWVKLSGIDHDTIIGSPSYSDTVMIGKAIAKIAPERVVWGTDWPHPSRFSGLEKFPNDAQTLDLLAEQVPDETLRYKVLVENPEKLYGFKN